MRSSTSFLSCVKKGICLLFCGYLCVNTPVDGALNRAVSFPEAVKACAESGSTLAPASDIIGKQVPDDVTEVWDRSYQLEILIYYLGCAKVKSSFIIQGKRLENVITSECPQFCNQTLFALMDNRVGTITCMCPNTSTITNLVMDNPGACQPCSGSARYLCGGELDDEIYIALYANMFADSKSSYVNGGGCQRGECKNNRIHLSPVSCPGVNTYAENSVLLHNGHFLSPSTYCSYPQNKGKAFHSWREIYPCVIKNRPGIDYCRSKISFAKNCSFLKEPGLWENNYTDLCASEKKFYICEGDSLNDSHETSYKAEKQHFYVWIFGSLAVTFILAVVIVFVFKQLRFQPVCYKTSNIETPNHAKEEENKNISNAIKSVSSSNTLNRYDFSLTNKSAFESKININQEIEEVLKTRKQLAAETKNQVTLFCNTNDNYDLVGGEDHIYELVTDPEITKTIGHQFIQPMCKNASLNLSTECENGEWNCTATIDKHVYHILEKENEI